MSEKLSLEKGAKLALSKDNPGLTKLNIGLGWDVNTGNAGAVDLDACVILLKADGKAVGPSKASSIVYYGNLNADGIKHHGDNLTGAGDGDDEVVTIDLANVAPEVHKLLFLINIHEARTRAQNFGQVRNAFARAFDATTGEEFGKYDLSEDASTATGYVMAEVYRHDGGWKFGALGQPVPRDQDDLDKILSSYC